MTNPVQEHAYRSQRRYVFAVTLAAVILLPILLFLTGATLVAMGRSAGPGNARVGAWRMRTVLRRGGSPG